MKFKVGSFWRTRGGNKAQILANDIKNKRPVVARIILNDREEALAEVLPNGEYLDGVPHPVDLIEPWTELKKKVRMFLWEWNTPLGWCVGRWDVNAPNDGGNYRLSQLCPDGIEMYEE